MVLTSVESHGFTKPWFCTYLCTSDCTCLRTPVPTNCLNDSADSRLLDAVNLSVLFVWFGLVVHAKFFRVIGTIRVELWKRNTFNAFLPSLLSM